jgi:formate dehydrogenase major subunit/formate dehydrogenase alpha subunit
VHDGRIVRVTSAHDAPVNGMALCVKGRYGYDYVHHPDRLTRPLVRRELLEDERQAKDEGPQRATKDERRRTKSVVLRPSSPVLRRSSREAFVEVDWDTALDLVARKFAEVKRAHGGDAIAVLASAKCTSEENYLFNKLTRQVLGTNNIDHCARL